MNPSWTISDDLERVLRRNSLLIGRGNDSKAFQRPNSLDSEVNCTLGDWYNQSVLSQILVQHDGSGECNAQNLTNMIASDKASCIDCSLAGSSGNLQRLNDVLQSNGFESISRGADIHEIINNCITAMSELSSRTVNLTHKLREKDRATALPRGERLHLTQQNSPQSVPTVPDTDIENRHREDESDRLRQVCKAQHNRIHALENHIRLKESELERVKAMLQERARKEDRRGAITMTSLREQKLGTNGFVLIHNLQRQIDCLTQDNESLARKCRELSVRLRYARDGPECTPSDSN